MIGRVFASVLNNTVQQQPERAQALAAFSGQIVRFALPGFTGCVQVLPDGRVQGVQSEVWAAEITIPLDALLSWPKDRVAARQRVKLHGDMRLALAVAEVLALSHWDGEAMLAKVAGDAAAHRILQVWQSRQLRQRDRWQRLAETVSDYVVFEGRLVASKAEIEQFCQGVDEVRDHSARLEARVAQLPPHEPQA